MIEAWFDGACWPNPNGHAASGALVKRDGVRIFEHAEYIGHENTSNNVAEYHGLIAVLKFLVDEGIQDAVVYGDADMVIKQMTGVWKAGNLTKAEKKGKIPIRPRYYLPYFKQANELRLKLPRVQFRWIRRNFNTEADFLSTKPLRDRGHRDNYYEPRQTESDRLDEAFEYALAK
jgi:ribonuclease HI